MTIRSLRPADWQAYFDAVSKGLAGERTMIEIEGLLFGAHRQARSLPLIGITYDQKSDLLEVAMEGLDHLIHRPKVISVSEGTQGLEQVDVDSEGRKQTIRLVKPLSHAYRHST